MSLLDKASLVVTPNAYKESKLYSVVPNTTLGDMDVVRATTATRVNSAGLIEVVPRNLFTYSEQFTNADWAKVDTTITANQPDPFGGNRATLVQFGTAASSVINQSLNLTSGTTYTLSVYIKGINLTDLRMIVAGNSSVSVISQIINGVWVRVTLTGIAGSTAFLNNQIARTTSALGQSFYIYGAQLEAFPTATEYFPTTTRLNIPRIDYTNGSCPSLLVEPQRTNLTLYSEQFDNAYWIKDIDVTVNSNASISPSGNLDADRVNFASNNKAIYKNITATGTHRFSIYLKGEGSNIGKQIQLLIGNVGGTVNVTLTSQWQRFTTDASTSTYVGVSKVGALQADSVLIWGSQLEAGAYATSYIPTVASTVTRNADVISKTGISSLIGQTEGTLFLDVKALANDNTTRQISISDNSFNNYVRFNFTAATNFGNAALISTGTTQATNDFTLNQTNKNKIAIKYNTNLFEIYLNGVLIHQDLSVNTFSGTTLSSLQFSNPLGGNIWYGNLNSLQFYKTALTNAECITLTTL